MRYIDINTISHTYLTVRPSIKNHQITTSVTSVTINTVMIQLTLHHYLLCVKHGSHNKHTLMFRLWLHGNSFNILI